MGDRGVDRGGFHLLGVKHVMDACRTTEYSGAWPPCECNCLQGAQSLRPSTSATTPSNRLHEQ